MQQRLPPLVLSIISFVEGVSDFAGGVRKGEDLILIDRQPDPASLGAFALFVLLLFDFCGREPLPWQRVVLV